MFVYCVNTIFIYGELISAKIFLDSNLGCLFLEFDRAKRAKNFNASVNDNHLHTAALTEIFNNGVFYGKKNKRVGKKSCLLINVLRTIC